MKEGYYHTKDSVKEYIHLSKEVSGAALIEELKKVLPAGQSVLEIGSGPGTDWKILSETYQVTGSDYSEQFLEHLRLTFPTGIFIEQDAATLTTDESFDGIYSNKVLHHLTDSALANSVKRQSEILNKKGVVCHSFWKGEDSEVFKGMYVRYHETVNLKRVFETYFDILSIIPYNEFEANDSLLLLARKK